MLDEAKDFAELRVFSEAQQKTIIKLTKKNKELEDEVTHLKKLLESTAPVIATNNTPVIDTEKFLSSDQEAICRMQLNRLKEVSFERELTLEEAKRVEIFSKIINVLENSPKTIKVETKNIDSKDLMSLIEHNEST